MRLASFNVLHGRSLADGLVDGPRLAAAVAALDADVVALQEVDRAQPRSGHLDLTAVAAGEALPQWRFAPALAGTPGGSWRAVEQGAELAAGEPAYGVGLATRLPVLGWHEFRLPAAPVRSPVLVPGPGRPRLLLLTDEPRVGLAAVVQSLRGPMTVASTHLSFVPGWNAHQLRRLTAALRFLPAPRVLLGDLNLPGALPRLICGWRQLARLATYPEPGPRLQLDHALGDGGVPAVLAARAIPMPLSDHRALVVDLVDRPLVLR